MAVHYIIVITLINEFDEFGKHFFSAQFCLNQEIFYY